METGHQVDRAGQRPSCRISRVLAAGGECPGRSAEARRRRKGMRRCVLAGPRLMAHAGLLSPYAVGVSGSARREGARSASRDERWRRNAWPAGPEGRWARPLTTAPITAARGSPTRSATPMSAPRPCPSSARPGNDAARWGGAPEVHHRYLLRRGDGSLVASFRPGAGPKVSCPGRSVVVERRHQGHCRRRPGRIDQSTEARALPAAPGGNRAGQTGTRALERWAISWKSGPRPLHPHRQHVAWHWSRRLGGAAGSVSGDPARGAEDPWWRRGSTPGSSSVSGSTTCGRGRTRSHAARHDGRSAARTRRDQGSRPGFAPSARQSSAGRADSGFHGCRLSSVYLVAHGQAVGVFHVEHADQFSGLDPTPPARKHVPDDREHARRRHPGPGNSRPIRLLIAWCRRHSDARRPER